MERPVGRRAHVVGMLAVPVLAGSCAYSIAEGANWKAASLNIKPGLASKFYTLIGVAIVVGLALDFAGLNAVKMLFWSAILNGLLVPPLVIIVVLLTSDRNVMGNRTNSRGMQLLGWTEARLDSSRAATKSPQRSGTQGMIILPQRIHR